MSNKEAVKILKKKLDTCTRATEQALRKKDYKAVEKSMRIAFVFMKAHSALKKQIPQKTSYSSRQERMWLLCMRKHHK